MPDGSGTAMQVASLFSGCGGLDLGLQRAGHRIIMQCESDKHCREVLKQHFPGTHVHQDVASIENLPKETELLAAGFPCVDVSLAGNRSGIYGAQTGLWLHIVRLLQKAQRKSRPVPWVLLENVPGILCGENKESIGIEHVCTAFERMGYNWAYRTIDASSFGMPMTRKRVFILASLHGDPRDALFAAGNQECMGGCHVLASDTPPSMCSECWKKMPRDFTGDDGIINLSQAQAPTRGLAPTFTGSNVTELVAVLPSQGRIGKLGVANAEKLMGFEPGYTDFSRLALWSERHVVE